MKIGNELIVPGLVAIAATIGLAACGERMDAPKAGQQGDPTAAQTEQRKDPMAANSNNPTQNGSPMNPSANTDAAVAAAVKAALANDSQLAAAKVEVQATAGKVVLTGSAPDSAARDRAGQLVASVKGVTSVDNQISVGSS